MVKFRFKTLAFLAAFLFSATLLHSQINLNYVFTADSLKGYDEKAAQFQMRQQIMDPGDYKGFMYLSKRNFINNKYKLNKPSYDAGFNSRIIPNGNNNIMAAPCVNEGFENGNINGWTGTIGPNNNFSLACNYQVLPTATTIGAPNFVIQTTPFVDPIIGAIPNSPFAGSKVVQLNDGNVSTNPFNTVRLSQNFSVTATNFLYEFAYIAINNGVHNCCEQPFMYVRVRDCVGILQACPIFSITPPSTGCPGTGPTSWSTMTVGPNVYNYNSNWQKYSIDLTSFIGSCVTLEVTVGDCTYGGHFGYAYFDSNCNTFGITLNNSTVYSAPTQTVNIPALCATTATLTAPVGLNPYLWNGPAGSGITNNTNQTISTSVPGDYTLQMTPVGVCNPIVRIVRLSFVPPLGVTASPTAICSAGSNSTAILTATGATTYTWSTGPNTSTISVSPSVTTIYTISATTSTCTGSQTVQVTVNPSPTISVSSSSNVVCTGGNVTLTAGGATTYTWFPGAITGSQVVVTPTASTNYTVLGANGGCPGTNSIAITALASPTVSAFSSATAVCSGNSVNLFAGGALTYTWQPGNLVGSNVAVTPLSTTVYTVTGSLLSCNDTETVSVTVANGPTLTITATPTTVCSASGGTAQLVASGAVSYTWNPGFVISPTIVITPTATTVYSVTGSSTLSCLTTNTISFSVTPTPTLNVSSTSTAVCAGNSATLTSSGATTYTWNPGALTGANVVVTPAANTTYTVVGANGSCTSSKTIALVVNANPTVTANSSPTVLCNGNTSTLTANGALTYTWNPGNLSGASTVVTPASTTNFTVVGSNAAGCTASAVAIVSVNTTPTLNPISTPPSICLGNTATLSTGGATTYTWNPGNLSGSSVTVSPASTTVYTVVGSNGNCSDTKTVNLTVNTIPTITAVSNPTVICAGKTATLTGNGATTYTWNPGALSGANVTVSPASNTTYTVIGSNGTCTNSAVVSLSVNGNPTLTASSNPTSICAGSGGTATLTGTGALTYTWNPGNLSGSTTTVAPVTTTNYTLSGTNAAGCTANATVNVVITPIPTLNVSASPTAICVGNSTTLTATGATSYTWNPGALIGASVSVSPATNTTYTLIGGNGICTSSTTILINVNANPTITASSSPTTICSGNSSTLTAIGALTYTWNPGNLNGANVSVSPLATTQYTVVGTNASGCTASAVANVSVNATPTLVPAASPTAICIGNTATLSSSGATSYTWNPGNLSGSSVTVSPASTTIYTVSGSNGNCVTTATVNLVVNPIPTVSASSNPTLICASNPATLTGSGATTYTWLPGSLTGANVVVTPTTTTTYTVIGSSLSCTNTATVTVNVNATPTVIASASPSNICSGSGGSSTLTASGAVSYVWNPGSIIGNNIVVTPTTTTTYTVIGSSPAGCLGTQTVTILISPTPTLSPISSPTAICIGGSATLSSTGATSYTWNPGALTGSSAIVSPASTTVYTITGLTGICSSTATVSLVVNILPTISALSNPTAICIGGSATLTGSGGTSYTWNPGALTGTSVVVSPASNTTYTVNGSNGVCSNTTTVSLIVNPLPILTAIASPTSVCAGSGSSSTLTASGAVSFTWNPLAVIGSTAVVTPTSTSVYSVTGTSSLGCNNSTTVSVAVIPQPTVSISSTPTAVCLGNSATLTGVGATTYTWYPGSSTGTSVVVSPTTATSYTVVGGNGTCTNTATYNMIVNPLPNILLTVSGPTTICSGNGTSLFAQGVVSATWQPGNLVGLFVTVTPTISTNYTVTGSNGFGCTSSKTVQINVITTPTVSVAATSTNICSGSTSTLSASGATSYVWQPGNLTTSVIAVTPTATTIYTVTGSNSFCTNTKTIQVIVNPTPTLAASYTPVPKCRNNSATLTATGATTYTWFPGALSGASVVVNNTVTTTFTVIGANGSCTSSAAIVVSVVPNPNVNTFANPVTICSGNSSTIFANGAPSFTWYPGATNGNSLVVTPTATSVYTVVGSNFAGCTGTATRTINVIPSPTLNPIASPSNICSGNSSTLTVTGANVYLWNPGALTGSNIVVSPSVTTVYTVQGNIGFCNATKTLVVNVNPTPTVVASAVNSLICASANATLNASGATSYTWLPGPIGGSVIVVSPLVNTTYTVTGSNSSGCTNTAVVTVSINPGPTVAIAATANSICAGTTVTLTPSGASNYTLYPGSANGTTFAVTPTVTTTYTILGFNLNGCPGVNTVQIVVNPIPVLSITPTSTGICTGNTVTLTATGATSYTWLPNNSTGSTFTDSPSSSTTYTLLGASAFGCSSTETVAIVVTPVPTITALSSLTVVCQSAPVTLIAQGATNYTWNPGSIPGGTIVVNPTVSTVYTVTGDNGGCSSTATVSIQVTPGPTSVTASTSGSITCLTNSVNLFGSTTSTNVSFAWYGPSSFTSSVQNPTAITAGGTYSFVVTDLNTGCSITATTAVVVNTTVPNFTVTSSGNLGCNTTVTLNASSSTTTGINYSWSGPNSFTSTSQSPTVNVAGDYTVSAFDTNTGCSGTLTISVTSDTNLPVFTATILPATCNGTATNNDGTILVSGNGVKYDYVVGATYTGTAVYLTATPIPTNGVITNTLANPLILTPYTVRIYGSNGCFKDTTLFLMPINCNNTIFGLTKAASTPSLVNNKYNITYTVTAVNASNNNLTNVILNENLNSTFPLPTTYTIVSAPVITSLNSSLTINPAFDGSSQVSLTSPLSSTLLPNKRDTIVFTVQIDPKGFFGPFVNSVIGFANDVNSLVVTDSSNDGFSWDPDQDGSPTNNNIPTIINLTPNTRLGVAKAGVLSQQLSDNTYDITYIVTVKNFGNDTLKNVQVKDSLNKTIPLPAQYSMKVAPSITGTLLTANASFNGNSDIKLLSGLDMLAPGQVDTIKFTINVKPDTVTVYKNTAIGYAINQFSTAARDSSQTGYNADPNANGNPNEGTESEPTVIIIPNSDLFIPEVFTPNGDGKNDLFVIKGLNGRKAKLTVFNRWGNKVYENSEYDNTWNGFPNAPGLIIGNSKLPQATYYYIIEFQDKDKEVKTGYVVLQY